MKSCTALYRSSWPLKVFNQRQVLKSARKNEQTAVIVANANFSFLRT